MWNRIKQKYIRKKDEKRLEFCTIPDALLKNLEEFQVEQNRIHIKGWIFPPEGKLEAVYIQFSDVIGNSRQELLYGFNRPDVAAILENSNGENSGFCFEGIYENGMVDTEVFLCFRWNGIVYGWNLGTIPGIQEQQEASNKRIQIQNVTPFMLDVFEENIQSVHIQKIYTHNVKVMIWAREKTQHLENLLEILSKDANIKEIILLTEYKEILPQRDCKKKIRHIYCEAGNGEKYILNFLRRNPFLLLIEADVQLSENTIVHLLYTRKKYDSCRLGTISAMILREDEKKSFQNVDDYVRYSCGIMERESDEKCILFCGKKPKKEKYRTLAEYKRALTIEGYQNVISEYAAAYAKNAEPVLFIAQYSKIYNYGKATQKPGILAICHELGGGAQKFLLEKKKEWMEANTAFVSVTYRITEGTYRIQVQDHMYEAVFDLQRWSRISELIEAFNIKKILVNELVTYLYLIEKLHEILEWKKKYHCEIIYYFHDYYALCPRFNLMNREGRYCDIPDLSYCDSCAKPVLMGIGENDISVTQWREEWENFLRQTDQIIVFSENTKEIIGRVWEGLSDTILVQPHKVGYLRKVKLSDSNKDEILRIGILGTINQHKGSEIIKEMCRLIERDSFPVKVILVGTGQELQPTEVLSITGSYVREQLPDIIEAEKIDLIFIPSVWPETFSYTAQEAIEMGMPVAVFNLGAPAERVKNYSKGLIVEKMDAGYALQRILRFTHEMRM